MTAEREIFYLNIPAFGIEVERVVNPCLRGRPVAVGMAHSARSVLQEISGEARAEGVEAGMPLGVALRVCRGLTVIPPNPELYERASGGVTGLVTGYTPLWEPQQPGRIYLDMSGSRRLFGPARDAAWRIERELEERLRLRASLGLAANKLVSRIAARTVPPRGIIDIERGNEASFMAPLSVRLLPGVGDVRMQTLLEELNVKRIGQVARVPAARLRVVFGAFAVVLRQRALGVDIEPVRLPARRPASTDDITLPEDTNDDNVLLGNLYSLVERIAAGMRAAGRPARDAALTVRHSDGVEMTRRVILASPTTSDFDLYEAVARLYAKATERRIRVRHMRVSFGHSDQIHRATQQLALDLDSPDDDPAREDRSGGDILAALDRIRSRHGYEAVQFGKTAMPRRVQLPIAAAAAANQPALPASTTSRNPDPDLTTSNIGNGPAREKAAGARSRGARSGVYALVHEHRSDEGDEADAVLSRD